MVEQIIAVPAEVRPVAPGGEQNAPGVTKLSAAVVDGAVVVVGGAVEGADVAGTVVVEVVVVGAAVVGAAVVGAAVDVGGIVVATVESSVAGDTDVLGVGDDVAPTS